jgi:two-component system, chemotaxis family, response regulator Rcp1
MTEPTVLIVEDNPADLYLVREAIRQHEVTAGVVALADGESTIRYIEQSSNLTDMVVVLDLNLPKRSGIQILEAIRAMPNGRSIPVIVFTSSLSEQDSARIAALGVTACMLKSLDLDEFNLIGWAIKQALLGQDSGDALKPPAA